MTVLSGAMGLSNDIWKSIINQYLEDDIETLASVNPRFRQIISDIDKQKLEEVNQERRSISSLKRAEIILKRSGRFLNYFEGLGLNSYLETKVKDPNLNLNLVKFCPDLTNLVLKNHVPNPELLKILDIKLLKLVKLDLTTNKLSNHFDVVLEKISQFPNLISLNLADTFLVDANIQKLSSSKLLKKLKCLNLSHLTIGHESVLELFKSINFKESSLCSLMLDQMQFDQVALEKAAAEINKKVNIVLLDPEMRKKIDSIETPEDELTIFYSQKQKRSR